MSINKIIETETAQGDNSMESCYMEINSWGLPLGKKATTHQLTTMLSTSKNVLAGARAIIKVKGHQHRWLAGGYDLEIGHF